LDASTLSQLLGENPDLERSILEDYLDSTKELVDALVEAINAGDTVAAGKTAHKLKSASRTLGALKLGELCQEMETAGGGG
jgi:HPt (histidine-containing phosphotransfer) domain-containing protein